MKKVVAFILVIIAIAGAASAWWLYFRHPEETVGDFKKNFVRDIESELRKSNHPLRQAIANSGAKSTSISVTGVECITKDNSDNAGRKGSNIKSIDVRILAKANVGTAKGLFVYKYLFLRDNNDELKIQEQGIIRNEVQVAKGVDADRPDPIDHKLVTDLSYVALQFGVDVLVTYARSYIGI